MRSFGATVFVVVVVVVVVAGALEGAGLDVVVVVVVVVESFIIWGAFAGGFDCAMTMLANARATAMLRTRTITFFIRTSSWSVPADLNPSLDRYT